MLFALLFAFVLLLLLAPFEDRYRKRRHLLATTPSGAPRARSWAYAVLGFLGLALVSSLAVATTGAAAPATGPTAEQFAIWAGIAVVVCRALSNLFPPNTIAYKVLHALGAGTGAEAQMAAASSSSSSSSSGKPSGG